MQEEQKQNENLKESLDKEQYAYSDIIIGLACAVGTDNSIIIEELTKQLDDFNYTVEVIKVSKKLLEPYKECTLQQNAARTNSLMTIGDEMRKEHGGCILAQGVAYLIHKYRGLHSKDTTNRGVAFIIDSLKHEEEISKLKEIYTSAFYIFAINESEKDREYYLTNVKNMGNQDAAELIERDTEEKMWYGQHTKVVFQLADFHLSIKDWRNSFREPAGKNKGNFSKKLKEAKLPIISKQISRILDLLFGNPYITPSFDEYAMFMAYSSALRSADLSRQVGAVISNEFDIIATGANDVPAPGGGQYWPGPNLIDYISDDNDSMIASHSGYDVKQGRDHTWGFDPNKHQIEEIIEEIINSFDYDTNDKVQEMPVADYKKLLREQLLKSPLKDLTEFSRAVHAEMAAMLSCARTGISLQNGTLYCTTFPCHNCARHAIFAGIKRVVFIEPYLKSKAIDLHKDSITITDEEDKVKFEQFVGVGPRRFFDLFSMRLSTGRDIIRKEDVSIIPYKRSEKRLRCSIPNSVFKNKEEMEVMNYIKKLGIEA